MPLLAIALIVIVRLTNRAPTLPSTRPTLREDTFEPPMPRRLTRRPAEALRDAEADTGD